MKPATLLETWKTLLTVLLEHDKFREEHFQQCLVSFGDSFFDADDSRINFAVYTCNVVEIRFFQ